MMTQEQKKEEKASSVTPNLQTNWVELFLKAIKEVKENLEEEEVQEIDEKSEKMEMSQNEK